MEEEPEDKMSLYALHNRITELYDKVMAHDAIIYKVGFWGFVIRCIIKAFVP